MRVQQLLEHHNIGTNPFAEEDAQSDPVFKDRCRDATYHPVWDKVFGNPSDPATSLVFGEKGSGKTAMRMQMDARIARYNSENGHAKLFVIQYDDFNPLLDHFADRLSARKQRDPEKVLAEWKLWDHMDAILSLGVTSLVDKILGVTQPTGPAGNSIDLARLKTLDRQQKRDLLLLAACYDSSTAENSYTRWKRLARRIGYYSWWNTWDFWLGCFVTGGITGVIVYNQKWSWLQTIWPYLIFILGWLPCIARWAKWQLEARRVVNNVRVLKPTTASLRRSLSRLSGRQLEGQPLPQAQRTDDRYELLAKFQNVLRSLGSDGVLVLVDRVDEPHLITGSVHRMKALIWPMLDNKFLKQPAFGLKLLLPAELFTYVEKEDRDFYQRARLDKQNMIPSLEWSGESLYDLANARIRACGTGGKQPSIRDLIDPAVSDSRIIEAFRSLRVPRHLFKFLHRLLVAHCHAHTDDKPVWQIAPETFESTLAVYRRDQDAADRGLQVG
jgi:hypothetical protein